MADPTDAVLLSTSRVRARAVWNDTGVDVRAGETLILAADGGPGGDER